MKQVKKPVFFIVFILIAVFTYFAIMGFSTYYGDIQTVHIRGVKDIRWGIDIRGGVDVTFTPSEDAVDVTTDDLDGARSIIETRMVEKNITDYEIYVDQNSKRIICRFPWQSDDDSFDPEQAVKELGETAMLSFRMGYSGDLASGQTYEDLELVLTGADVARAQAGYQREQGGDLEYIVSLTLHDSGKEAFKDATTRAKDSGERISIWMDDLEISAPSVSAVIADGQATISGSFDAESAKALADKINGGSLPFKLVTDSFSTISPTLGTGARDAMALAGIIAFCLISVLMIAMYRLPGVIAVISLAGQVAGTFAAITGFFAFNDSFTMTIPGIAGIILAVGMGVDANVITNERIKEELRAGKTIDGALYIGFRRAFSAIFDGNITMLIIAVILMGAFGTPDSWCAIILTPIFTWFGVSTAGSIYAFGYTLAVGVVLNFLFGILTTRLMTMSLSRFRIFRNPALYGGKKKTAGGVGNAE